MAKNESKPKNPNSKNGFRIPFMPNHLDEPHEIKAKVKEELEEFQITFLKEVSSLITSAFGLLAALAWRGVIQEFVDIYIRRLFGEVSGLISEFLFALIITLLAVLITWQITKIKQKLLIKKEKE